MARLRTSKVMITEFSTVVHLTVATTVEVWAFSFSPRYPSSLGCKNEYQAVDGGGNVSEKSSCSNCS